jgi:hypothetical protein
VTISIFCSKPSTFFSTFPKLRPPSCRDDVYDGHVAIPQTYLLPPPFLLLTAQHASRPQLHPSISYSYNPLYIVLLTISLCLPFYLLLLSSGSASGCIIIIPSRLISKGVLRDIFQVLFPSSLGTTFIALQQRILCPRGTCLGALFSIILSQAVS